MRNKIQNNENNKRTSRRGYRGIQIDGCQSRVWLQADLTDGKVVFQAESDALIVKGIIALLIKVVSGHTPDEILNSDFYFIEKIGLKEHLSPTQKWKAETV